MIGSEETNGGGTEPRFTVLGKLDASIWLQKKLRVWTMEW